MQNLPTFLYWIEERDKIRFLKEAGNPKPWSTDPVFQVTYFCNVRREHDKVTRFIRRVYSPYVNHSLFVHNIILSRFLNWPPTLEFIGYLTDDLDWAMLNVRLNNLAKQGKVWGNAYVVTTHGIPMDKIDYLTDRVVPSIFNTLNAPRPNYKTCEEYADLLQCIEGISTFMAGQVVADLKNTLGHPLRDAPDFKTFALPGPGSIRGMDWLYGRKVPRGEWYGNLMELQKIVWNERWHLCAQDLQNCLCEFDKYMRVSTGKGRSKRSYNGTGG